MKSVERVLKKHEKSAKNLVEIFFQQFFLKRGLRNTVEKLCRTFGWRIGWTNLMKKLLEKLVDQLCGKIVWNSWVDFFLLNLGETVAVYNVQCTVRY